MTPFTSVTSVAVPVLRDNVDTDAIIPSREMRTTGRTGLADGLFAPWRYTDADARLADPEFALNDPRGEMGTILLGGANFGCGSSREHAVWALAEYGFRCVIAESFAPIFYANCLRNGLLALTLPRAVIEQAAWHEITVDLESQTVTQGEHSHAFSIDAEARAMLLEGIDVIDLTLKHATQIAGWASADAQQRPWVYLEKAK